MKLFIKHLFPSYCHSVKLTSNSSPQHLLLKQIRLSFVPSFVCCMLDDNLTFSAFPEKVRKMVGRMLLTSIKGSVVTKVVAVTLKFWLFFFVSCRATVCSVHSNQ